MSSIRKLGRQAQSSFRVVGSATLVLLLIIHFTPLTKWWAWFLAGGSSNGQSDTLIVLAAEIEIDGVLGPASYIRTLYAVRAYRQTPFRSIIVTGGRSGASPKTMGDAMRDFLIANGVPAGIVHVESRAMSTRENALFVKSMLPDGSSRPVLMTSDFHMFRARRVFERAGIPVLTRPVPDVLRRSNHIVNRWGSFWTLALETTKIGYYAWERWL